MATKKTLQPYHSITTGHSLASRRWAASMWRRYWRTLDTAKGRREHGDRMQCAGILDRANGRQFPTVAAAARSLRVDAVEMRRLMSIGLLVGLVAPAAAPFMGAA